MSNNNWIVVVILIGLLRSSVVTGLATPPALSNINPSAITTTNNDVKKDSISASPSNVQPQYAPPPIAYPPPPPGQYSQQFPPSYLMQSNQNQNQPPPQDNSFADIKSDISSLRDTVMLLSNVVKQNAMPSSRSSVSLDGEPENNGRGRNVNSYGSSSYANNPPAQNNYQNNNNNKQNYQNNNHNYGPGDANTYDGPPIQIEVIQSKKGYDQPSAKVIKDPPKEAIEEKKADPLKISGLANLLPSLSASVRTNVVAHAERTFAVIKRGIRNALVTGLIVAVVRLLPLLWVGLRLIFNAILPLVGISLQGTTQYHKAFSLSGDTKQVAQDTVQVTPAPARALITNDGLDEELANLESNFDIFKGRMF